MTAVYVAARSDPSEQIDRAAYLAGSLLVPVVITAVSLLLLILGLVRRSGRRTAAPLAPGHSAPPWYTPQYGRTGYAGQPAVLGPQPTRPKSTSTGTPLIVVGAVLLILAIAHQSFRSFVR